MSRKTGRHRVLWANRRKYSSRKILRNVIFKQIFCFLGGVPGKLHEWMAVHNIWDTAELSSGRTGDEEVDHDYRLFWNSIKVQEKVLLQGSVFSLPREIMQPSCWVALKWQRDVLYDVMKGGINYLNFKCFLPNSWLTSTLCAPWVCKYLYTTLPRGTHALYWVSNIFRVPVFLCWSLSLLYAIIFIKDLFPRAASRWHGMTKHVWHGLVYS